MRNDEARPNLTHLPCPSSNCTSYSFPRTSDLPPNDISPPDPLLSTPALSHFSPQPCFLDSTDPLMLPSRHAWKLLRLGPSCPGPPAFMLSSQSSFFSDSYLVCHSLLPPVVFSTCCTHLTPTRLGPHSQPCSHPSHLLHCL